MLVGQDRIDVEVFTRQPDDRWVLWETDDLDAAFEFPEIGANLAVADIYDRVPGIAAAGLRPA